MSMRLPETRHIRVGYLDETWGDITLDSHDAHKRPRYTGHDTRALRNLYTSVAAQPLYHGLTPPQILARMTLRMSGPTWAVAINADGQPERLTAKSPHHHQKETPDHD